MDNQSNDNSQPNVPIDPIEGTDSAQQSISTTDMNSNFQQPQSIEGINANEAVKIANDSSIPVNTPPPSKKGRRLLTKILTAVILLAAVGTALFIALSNGVFTDEDKLSTGEKQVNGSTQRHRDVQRKDDIARLQSSLNYFQANNRGMLPSNGAPGTVHGYKEFAQITGRNDWADFYNRYLLLDTNGVVTTFVDPSGNPYGLTINLCSATGTTEAPSQGLHFEATCQNTVQRKNVKFEEQINGTAPGANGVHYSVSVVIGAACKGEDAVASNNVRKVAMLYKLEGDGAVCINN
jgi:hypothetical protein